jgi:hypothetical protein
MFISPDFVLRRLLAALNADGVRQFQPRVASTLGLENGKSTTLKALAPASFANTFGVALTIVSSTQG